MIDKREKTLRGYFGLIVPIDLADDEFVRISVFRKDTVQEKTFFIKTVDDLIGIIGKYRYAWNVYINAATVKGQKGGKREDLFRRQILFLDFDKKDYPEYKTVTNFVTHIKRKLPQLYNHCIVDSGNGYHFYIAIKTSDDIDRVTRINAHIAKIVGADMSAVKTTQIMRIPTSLNLKQDSKPVSIVSSVYGTDSFKPYELTRLESMMAAVSLSREISQKTPVSFSKLSYYCIEKMLDEGCEKSERNFALGRIVKYLQEVRGYNEFTALQVVLDWNLVCSPPKDTEEVKTDFKAYWKSDYRLLGCTVADERKQAILSRYCDRYACKAIQNGEWGTVEGKEIQIDNFFLTDDKMKAFKGNHFLIITILYIHSGGLTLPQIKQSILTKKTKRPCIDSRALNVVLSDLLARKIISCDGVYKLIQVPNYGRGYIRFYYQASIFLINKIITQREYLVYLALVRNLQQGKNVTYDTLAALLGIDKSNIAKCIKSLHDGYMLTIEKVHTEKGLLANRYVLYA